MHMQYKARVSLEVLFGMTGPLLLRQPVDMQGFEYLRWS